MYEELIAELREEAEWAKANEWETPIMLSDHLTQAADAIEELSAAEKKYLANISALETENQHLKRERYWIPVTERLPEDWRSVLVHCAAGEARWIQIADVVRGKWRLLPGYADAKVTHWMPLPEPPKEET